MNTNEENLEENRKYKELEEENNRLKAEIKKLKDMLEEKNDNEQINEISNSKLEEKDSSINISFNPNKKENFQSLFSISNAINDDVNSISYNSTDIAINKIMPYSPSNNHFICQICKKIPELNLFL